jgi:hypothetical protein
MLRLAAVLMVLATTAGLAACTGDDDDDATDTTTESTDEAGPVQQFSEDELEPLLLTDDDVPSGWQELLVTGTDDEDRASLCNEHPFRDAPGGGADMYRTFTQDDVFGPFMNAGVFAFEDVESAEAAMDAARDAISSCDEYIDSLGGENAPTKIRVLDFPPIADDQAAFQILQDGELSGVKVEGVYMRVGNLVVGGNTVGLKRIGVGDYESMDAEAFVNVMQTAYDRAEAGLNGEYN